MTRALYPGTFDPIHNGHIDITTRASAIFDEVIVAVYDAPPKRLLFETDERLLFAAQALEHLPNVTVTSYVGLTVDCAYDLDAKVIVRGLRNVADFEYEHQIGWANTQLAPDLELCCLFCNGEFAYLSATILKEVASLNGDYSRWAPAHVQRALQARFNTPEPTAPRNVTHSDTKLSHRS